MCVSHVVEPEKFMFYFSQTLSDCDDNITDMILDHDLGNNQTAITIAYAYLKSRGVE